jgi:hypothetical protein
MEITKIIIPEFSLEWTDWYPWDRFLLDARNNPNAIKVPNFPGVYEAKLMNEEQRLTIGKASNLRMRVKQGLVKGKVPHSSGEVIQKYIELSQIVIRWAITDRPSCAEEELHKQYAKKHGVLPIYTKRT